VSSIAPAYPDPRAFNDLELVVTGVSEVELAVGVGLVELPVALQGRRAIGADLDDGHAIYDAAMLFGVGV
jgi:hypothetical protein